MNPTKTEICPHCHDEIERVPIVYGLPGWELGQAEERGQLVLGGCVVSADQPEWACPSCREPLDDWAGPHSPRIR